MLLSELQFLPRPPRHESLHTPLFLQGLLRHSSMSTLQLKPDQPALHVQAKG